MSKAAQSPPINRVFMIIPKMFDRDCDVKHIRGEAEMCQWVGLEAHICTKIKRTHDARLPEGEPGHSACCDQIRT